ncbi:MAG: hypothetical protein ABIJ34_08285 [archaeon]
MRSFEEFLAEGKVVRGVPDPSESGSLKKQAIMRINDLKLLPIGEQNASFRFESAYESIREILQSYLAADGYKAYSHEAIIAFAKENSIISEADAFEANRIRQIRNDINYRAKLVTPYEAKEAIDFADKIINKLKD